MMLRKHQLCQFLSLQNKIGNATETRKRAWEVDCACQLHSEISLQGSTPMLQSKTPIHEIHGVYIVGGRLNETQFHSRANMVPFEKVMHLYDFVVDAHCKILP